MVQVLSKPSCVQCTATYRALDAKGIQYTTIDMSKDPEALKLAISLGHQSAPVVIVGDDSWSGFRPDKIEELTSNS